jgi:hypothetical protein
MHGAGTSRQCPKEGHCSRGGSSEPYRAATIRRSKRLAAVASLRIAIQFAGNHGRAEDHPLVYRLSVDRSSRISNRAPPILA